MNKNIKIDNHKYRILVQDLETKEIITDKKVDAIFSVSSANQLLIDIIALYNCDKTQYLKTLYGLNSLVKNLNEKLSESDLMKMKQIAHSIRRHPDFGNEK